MIAGDTSSISAYFKGDSGPDVDRIDLAFQNGELILPPPVLSELLSDPASGADYRNVILRFDMGQTLWKVI